MTDKVDLRLREEIRVRRESALAEGRNRFDPSAEAFDVIIDLAGEIDPPQGVSRKEALDDISRQARDLQAGVTGSLRALGVTEYESLPLSNSVATTLTLDQISDVARREDVELIRFRGIEKVTT